MNIKQKYLFPLISGVVFAAFSGYTFVSQSNARENLAISSTESETAIAQRLGNNNNTNTSNEITVTVYQADNQCEGFTPQQVKVSQRNSLEAAVGKVLELQNNGDFAIAGYRVQVDNQNKVATIDLRLPVNSERQFISLSPCELFSLFGSIRQTLTSNSQWNINEVRFTEKGQDIFL
jgi:hypothetical protein